MTNWRFDIVSDFDKRIHVSSCFRSLTFLVVFVCWGESDELSSARAEGQRSQEQLELFVMSLQRHRLSAMARNDTRRESSVVSIEGPCESPLP